MKILFGIPDITHRELVDLEIDGIKAIVTDCHTIHYGPVNSKRGLLNKLIFTLKNAFAIKKALKSQPFDLLFLNSTFDFNGIVRDTITYLILRALHIRIFLKFHGSDPALLNKGRGPKKLLAVWLLKRVNGVGVLSYEEKSTYISKGFIKKDIFIVKNPVDPSLYKKDSAFRGKMGIDPNAYIFIFCGRFLPFKGLMDVLEAFNVVEKQFPNIHLFCIGDGPEMHKARHFVEITNLKQLVTFTGFIPEIQTRYYYTNCNALVFPSEHEGFPMVVFQSLAAGLPIITTRITASADYLNEPDNVLWVEFNNPQQVASAMMQLLTNEELTKNMKANNLLKAKDFTTEKNALEYYNIFNELVNQPIND